MSQAERRVVEVIEEPDDITEDEDMGISDASDWDELAGPNLPFR